MSTTLLVRSNYAEEILSPNDENDEHAFAWLSGSSLNALYILFSHDGQVSVATNVGYLCPDKNVQ